MRTGEIAAVVFDMDGVLIDSEPLQLEATNAVLGRLGAVLTPDDLHAYLGWTEVAFWRDLKARFSLPDPEAHYGAERRAVLLSLLQRHLPMTDGIADVLHAVKAAGLKLAVASSSERVVIEHVLDAGGLAHYFDAIAAGDEVDRSKPDPEIFLLAARRLNVEPAACLAFEDSPSGIRAALAAGMRCVRVVTTTTRGMECPDTDAVIDRFTDLDVSRMLSETRPRASSPKPRAQL